MKRILSWVAMLTASGLMASCRGGAPAPALRYEIHREVLAAGPPPAAGQAVRTAPEVASHPEVEIEPQQSPLYESLAEEIKNLYGPSPVPVSLEDVVTQTLAHNREIRIQQYSYQIADYAVPISKSIYDLLLQASAEARRAIRQSQRRQTGGGGQQQQTPPGGGVPGIDPNDPIVQLLDRLFASIFGGGGGQVAPIIEQRNREISASATQLLPTGAQVQFAYTFTRLRSDPDFGNLNPLLTHAVTLSLTQPLLRGFGPRVTNADIHIAQLDRNASAADLEGVIQEQLAAGLRTYWDLISAVHRYDVQVIAYMAALDLLRINRAKYEAGTLAQTEVIQAQARVEARLQEVIRARQAVRDLEDDLKRLMFFQEGTPAWNVELKPTQELAWRQIDVDLEEALAEALNQRPELRFWESRLDRSEVQIVKARNARLPRLDLVASAGATGLDMTGSEAFDRLESLDFNNLSIGLELSYPFQNRQARFFLKQREAEKGQVLEQYERQVDLVVLDVRKATRALETARNLIQSARQQVQSEQANLAAEIKKYEVGISTLFQVLEFQENLAEAQNAFVAAIVGYNQAAIALERARGALLRTYGVIFDAPDFAPAVEPVLFPIGFH